MKDGIHNCLPYHFNFIRKMLLSAVLNKKQNKHLKPELREEKFKFEDYGTKTCFD